jgi:hypothetical protein
MKGLFGAAALAAAVLAGPAGAQFHGGTPLEQATSAYGQCVYARARAARQSGASADAAIASGFSRCKGERKRLLNATRSRLAAAGLRGASAKSSAQSMMDSGDRMISDDLRQEFTGRRGADGAAPK